MSVIITADTHWNDNPRDESRWGLFSWLCNQQADELLILGDLTVAKNNHPARLVNRLVDGFLALARHYKHVYVLKGNHDYADPDCPFFGFLRHTKENIHFIPMPDLIKISIGEVFFMPAGTNWEEHLNNIYNRNVFAHATFDGAISETGYQLTGVSPKLVYTSGARVISGDIHKPQKLETVPGPISTSAGKIEYVGAPYHIRFGDDYTPRLLHISDDFKQTDLHYPSPRKYTQIINSLGELYRIAIKEGDQIKIIAQMRRADLPEWKSWRDAIREQADKLGWVLHGPELRLQQDDLTPSTSTVTRQSPEQLVEEYITRQKASEAHRQFGLSLLKQART
jgi:DNA repair exonuclease SbcCD nuclease subunit